MYYTAIETPIGWLLLVGIDGELIELKWPKPSKQAAEAGAPPEAIESPDGFGKLPELLRLYFEGKPVDFSQIPIRFPEVGEFEQCALREAMKTPYGSLTSYGDIAAAIGSPRAARAVGNAMRKNPTLLVVPCHRVVHSNGKIGGFACGSDLKHKLLALEGVNI